MPWMNVTAEAPALNWPTNVNDVGLAASRTTTQTTGTSGLADASLVTIKSVMIGASSAAAVLNFYAQDGTTLLRTINAVGTIATNLQGNIGAVEWDIQGGFACNVDAGVTANIFVQYEYKKKWPSS